MAIRIAILQTGDQPEKIAKKYHSHSALFQKLFAGYELEFKTFEINHGIFPDDIYQADGYIITGSLHGVYEGYSWISKLEQFVRDCFANDIPVVGICFGHQLMAQALGGSVEKFKGGWNVGRTLYKTSDGDHLYLNAFHQDQVLTPPENATPFLSSEFCKYAGLSYGKNGLSLQPHPEMDDEFIADLLDVKGSTILSSMQLEDAYNSLDKHIDVEVAIKLLLNRLAPDMPHVNPSLKA